MRYCITQGCPTLVDGGYCPPCAAKRERARPNVSVRKWYGLAVWQRLRRLVLAEQPLCATCETEGRVTPATDVDHIEPHRGTWDRFIDRANLQGLCHPCHSVKTQGGR